MLLNGTVAGQGGPHDDLGRRQAVWNCRDRRHVIHRRRYFRYRVVCLQRSRWSYKLRAFGDLDAGISTRSSLLRSAKARRDAADSAPNWMMIIRVVEGRVLASFEDSQLTRQKGCFDLSASKRE